MNTSPGVKTVYDDRARCGVCRRPCEEILREVHQGLVSIEWECSNCRLLRLILAQINQRMADLDVWPLGFQPIKVTGPISFTPPVDYRPGIFTRRS